MNNSYFQNCKTERVELPVHEQVKFRTSTCSLLSVDALSSNLASASRRREMRRLLRANTSPVTDQFHTSGQSEKEMTASSEPVMFRVRLKHCSV